MVEVEYIPEKVELEGVLDEKFRKVFEKFNFSEFAASEVKKYIKLEIFFYDFLFSSRNLYWDIRIIQFCSGKYKERRGCC